MPVLHQNRILIRRHGGGKAITIGQGDIELRPLDIDSGCWRIGGHGQRSGGSRQINFPEITSAIPNKQIGFEGHPFGVRDHELMIAQGDFLTTGHGLAIKSGGGFREWRLTGQSDGKVEPGFLHQSLMRMNPKQYQHQQKPPP